MASPETAMLHETQPETEKPISIEGELDFPALPLRLTLTFPSRLVRDGEPNVDSVQAVTSAFGIVAQARKTIAEYLGRYIGAEALGDIKLTITEELNNIAGHSGDRHVFVTIELQPSKVVARISSETTTKGYAEKIDAATLPSNPGATHGRGGFLMKELSQHRDYDENGNLVFEFDIDGRE